MAIGRSNGNGCSLALSVVRRGPHKPKLKYRPGKGQPSLVHNQAMYDACLGSYAEKSPCDAPVSWSRTRRHGVTSTVLTRPLAMCDGATETRHQAGKREESRVHWGVGGSVSQCGCEDSIQKDARPKNAPSCSVRVPERGPCKPLERKRMFTKLGPTPVEFDPI